MDGDSDVEDFGPSEVNTTKASHLVKVHKDKLTVTYSGKANHNHDVGAVQANRAFSHNVMIGYFEMTIINQGERACMAIGLSNTDFKSTRHPGWEPGSYGYHGDDGRKFHNNSRGEPYAVKFGAVDDVIGCGLNFAMREIFFTKNGKYLGTAFTDPSHSYYPTVGLHSTGEEVRINFGTDPSVPFVFNLEEMLREHRDKMLVTISQVPISMTDVNELVRNFLHHQGYSDALASFEESAALPSRRERDVNDAEEEDASHWTRSEIRQLIIDGNLAAARLKCEEHFPDMFQKKPVARAQILCQEFSELILKGETMQALLFARSVLGPLLKASAAAIAAEAGQEGATEAPSASASGHAADGEDRSHHHCDADMTSHELAHELGHGDADEAAGDSIRSGGSGRDGRGGEGRLGSDRESGWEGVEPQMEGKGSEGGDGGGCESWVEQHAKVFQV